MRMSRTMGMSILAAGLLLTTAAASAQEPLPSTGSEGVDVGQPAPDFEFVGSTRYGTVGDPVKLSDFRGKTVVLAFFFQVRTKG